MDGKILHISLFHFSICILEVTDAMVDFQLHENNNKELSFELFHVRKVKNTKQKICVFHQMTLFFLMSRIAMVRHLRHDYRTFFSCSVNTRTVNKKNFMEEILNNLILDVLWMN